MDSQFGITRQELRNFKWMSMDRLGNEQLQRDMAIYFFFDLSVETFEVIVILVVKFFVAFLKN